ncbi:MAG TPA: response regulator [Patescibacteria group bacterium]
MTKKVYIVDDDEGILDAISLILEESGYKVETSSKGNQTYERVTHFHPDIILLDVLMSGYDGRKICKILKQDSKTSKIPVVMISAHPSAKKHVMEYGAEAFLSKPFETNELLDTVAKFTNG